MSQYYLILIYGDDFPLPARVMIWGIFTLAVLYGIKYF